MALALFMRKRVLIACGIFVPSVVTFDHESGLSACGLSGRIGFVQDASVIVRVLDAYRLNRGMCMCQITVVANPASRSCVTIFVTCCGPLVSITT